MTSERSPFATPTERLATYFDCAQPRETFEDRDIDDIATLLEQCGHIASKCPRTYILFRTIGQLEIVERLVNAGFSDQFFPVEARNLPTFLDLDVIRAVVQQQGLILTKSLDLENGRHRHFTPGETLPFEILGRLGSGSYGQVDRILSRTSFRQYALKRIRRRAAFGNKSSREAVRGFLNEMQILRGLQHRHIVQYIGSYTDKSYLGLVMSPVADTDLASYNTRLCGFIQTIEADKSSFYSQDGPLAAEMSSNLRTFYGCLAAALLHLHQQSIRHKDIKPQNILVAKGNVLLTDFGLSHDFADDVGGTTSGVTPASARYCAPEVAGYEKRNTSSDIWSLGCVFLEMTAALQGLDVEWIKQFFVQGGSEETHFHNNPGATVQLIENLRNAGDPRDQRTLTWIEEMVVPSRGARLTAAQVIEMITSPEASDIDMTPNTFCGICCVPDLESDSLDSLADDFDFVTAIPPLDHGSRKGSTQQSQANDSQPSTLVTISLEAHNELPTSDIPISSSAPSAIPTSSTESRALDTQTSNAASPIIATFPAEIPHINPKENPFDGAPNSVKQTLPDAKANVDAEPASEKEIPLDKDTTHTSAPSQSRRSSQREAVFDDELLPNQEAIDDESIVDIGSYGLKDRVRKVFGRSILASTYYAFHQLVSTKTVGGATLSGRIPTVIFSCGNLILSSFDKGNILVQMYDESSSEKIVLYYQSPWVPNAFEVDNHRNGYIKPLGWKDSGTILHAYLSTLPKPIIPSNILDRILEILSSPDTHEEKQKWLQIALLQMRRPYCLTVFFLLNLCASCTKRFPSDKDLIVEAYYSCFFGPDTLSSKIEEGEKKFVLSFMIENAEYLLGGPISGETVSEDNESLLQKLNGEQASSESTDRPTENLVDQVQLGQDNSTPDIIQRVPSMDSLGYLSSRNRVITELLAEGITDDQIEKYSSHIVAYVDQSQSLIVMGTPLWITTLFAGVERSTFGDFTAPVDIRCVVPIIIAECCRLMNLTNCFHCEKIDSSHFGVFRSSLTLNRRSSTQEMIASLISIFETRPHFGIDRIGSGYGLHNFAATLFTYLSSLPEPIIPYSTSKEILNCDLPSIQPTWLQCISELPRSNRDTLIYLLLFLNNCTKVHDEISRKFQPVIFGVDSSIARANFALLVMIYNAPSVVKVISGAKLVTDTMIVRPITFEVPSERVTSQDFVVAKKDFSPCMGGDLSFREGDRIRVIKRTEDGWWFGEVRREARQVPGKSRRRSRPERGLFPKRYTKSYKDPVRKKKILPFSEPERERSPVISQVESVSESKEPKSGLGRLFQDLFNK